MLVSAVSLSAWIAQKWKFMGAMFFISDIILEVVWIERRGLTFIIVID